MAVDSPGVIVFVPDLLLRQRFVEGLTAGGIAARGVSSEARMRTALTEAVPAGIVVELDGPGIDGLDLVTRLKADPATSTIPLLGVCAHTQVDLITGARAAGCDRVASRGELERRLGDVAGAVFGLTTS